MSCSSVKKLVKINAMKLTFKIQETIFTLKQASDKNSTQVLRDS